MIDPRLGRVLLSLQLPVRGTWRQEGEGERRQLALGRAQLSLCHPGQEALEQDSQALLMTLPELPRLCQAAAQLGYVDLAGPRGMAQALREAAGAHFAQVYVELEWDAGWSLHQLKQAVDVAQDSPELQALDPALELPLFAARALFGEQTEAGDWVGFAMDGISGLVLRILWEQAAHLTPR